MVYNPPVEVGEDGEPIKDGGVALTHPVNPMRRGAYVEQATRATGWAVMYVLGWLLMRLSCYAGLPDDCNTPSEPLEVLTVLLVLLVFSLAQVSENQPDRWEEWHEAPEVCRVASAPLPLRRNAPDRKLRGVFRALGALLLLIGVLRIKPLFYLRSLEMVKF